MAALFIGGGVRLERVYGKKREALEVWEAELRRIVEPVFRGQ